MDPDPVPDPLTDLAEARMRIDLGLLESANRMDAAAQLDGCHQGRDESADS
ncbi:MAG: hypothetical protein NVSMB16_16520 [Acidimicrobiales bacterium]